MATVTPTSQALGAEAIKRRPASADLAINTSLGSCDVLDFRSHAAGTIKLPASVTGLVFHGMSESDDASPTVIRVADDISSGLTAGQWIDFPPEAFSHSWLKIQSVGASGTAKVRFKT